METTEEGKREVAIIGRRRLTWYMKGDESISTRRGNVRALLPQFILGYQGPTHPTQTELVGFSGEQLIPIGKIKLEVKFGEGGLTCSIMMKFTVVRASSPYNIILGRTGMRDLRVVSSMVHAMVKFPTPGGIATVISHTEPVDECR
ncbi:hypothetical protein Tco_0389669 [Tanacetum coccineum]